MDNLQKHLPEVSQNALAKKFRRLKDHAIDYVALSDAQTPLQALNWLIVTPTQASRVDFIKLVLEEQPEKNFWEALECVCEAWSTGNCSIMMKYMRISSLNIALG